VFSLENGECLFIFRGHRDIIHDMQFTSNDRYLYTVSADFDMKLWSIPENSNEYIDEDDSEKMCLRMNVNHPSYIYAIKIF